MSTNRLPHIYSFGPVPSRRLGRSLGINNIPAKVCSYSCIYCQAGRTTRMMIDRCPFFDPHMIVQDVRMRLAAAGQRSERVDYLSFVPNGEPTLDKNLGVEISSLKALGVPIAVITNSSLLCRDDVQEELCLADWVSMKLDTTQEAVWRCINRPQKKMRLSFVLDAVRAFAKAFKGKLVTETMLVKGFNDEIYSLGALAEFIAQLGASESWLSVPTRPPAETWAWVPEEKRLNDAFQVFAARVSNVGLLTGYEGNDFAFTGDVERDLLSATAVHPMKDEAVRDFLKKAGSSWNTVERLLEQGVIIKAKFAGDVFYLRRYSKTLKS